MSQEKTKLEFDYYTALNVPESENIGRILLDEFVGEGWISGEQDELWLHNYIANASSIIPSKPTYHGAGKVAIHVGSSPAILRQLETFKEVAEDPRFVFIVCNGSYKLFLENGIEPDYVFIVEARKHVISDVDIVAPSTKLIHSPFVDSEILRIWPKEQRECFLLGGGKKYEERIRKDFSKLDIGGGNVLSTSILWAYGYPGFRDFILTGVSLCYYDNYYHDGRSTKHVLTDIEQYKGKYQAPDMYGQIVDTTPPLTMYKVWLETYLRYADGARFINATEDGILGVYPIPVSSDEKKATFKLGYIPWISITPLTVAVKGYKDLFKRSDKNGSEKRLSQTVSDLQLGV